jgi:hypothetical protein
MRRGILTALLSGVILFAFAALPPMLPGSTTASLFGSAQAEKATTPKMNVNRMGGGGGAKAGGAVNKQTGNTQSPKSKRLNAQPDPLNPQPEPPGIMR